MLFAVHGYYSNNWLLCSDMNYKMYISRNVDRALILPIIINIIGGVSLVSGQPGRVHCCDNAYLIIIIIASSRFYSPLFQGTKQEN